MLDKIKEYINLIPKITGNVDRIVRGIINDVKFNHKHLSENAQNEIIQRRVICISCPFNSTNAPSSEEYMKLYGEHYKTERVDLHCAHCACNIHWKTAVLEEKCGLSYYNDLHPTNKQELKWNEFTKTEENAKS